MSEKFHVYLGAAIRFRYEVEAASAEAAIARATKSFTTNPPPVTDGILDHTETVDYLVDVVGDDGFERSRQFYNVPFFAGVTGEVYRPE